MTAWWIRLSAELRDHPKVVEAGYHGGNVFVELLCLNGKHGFDGVVPARYAKPKYLAVRLHCDEATVTDGLDACESADLVQHLEDGSLYIVGWGDEWKPPAKTDAERQRNYRVRHATVTPPSRQLTDRNVTVTASNDRHVDLEQDLDKEKKEEREPAALVPLKGDAASRGTAEAKRLTALAVDKLNRDTGSRYEATDSVFKLVKALVTAGYGERELRGVIWHRAKRWKGDPKMDEYLRPKTLFAKANFENYVPQAARAFDEANGEGAWDAWPNKPARAPPPAKRSGQAVSAGAAVAAALGAANDDEDTG